MSRPWAGRRSAGTTATRSPGTPLLEVEDLRITFPGHTGDVHAVNGVDLTIGAGQQVGLVGESGCGKTVTSLAILGLLPPGTRITGRLTFDGQDLLADGGAALPRLRGSEIAMIFQDPMTSLNPVMTIGRQLTETLLAHVATDRHDAERRATDLLDQVGIPDPARQLRAYPHQLSGGMRQRVMIAIALCGEPRLLVADEPTTALDVTVQAQILELLREVVTGRDTALLLITHDLGVVAGVCDEAHVMYAGRIVERGGVEALFGAPAHHYTRGLLDAIPGPAMARKSQLQPIPGRPPRLLSEPRGCAFAPRCPAATPECTAEVPLPRPAPGRPPGLATDVACIHPVPAGVTA